MPTASKAEMERIFRLQKSRTPALAARSAADRIRRLKDLQAAIESNLDEIKKALQDDFGKPGPEVELTEIYPVLSELKEIYKNLKRWMRPEKRRPPWAYLGSRNRILSQPKGVVLIISPWNFPFQLAMGPLVSALAAGNSVILKPSENSPHTSRLLRSLLTDAFPESEVAVFEGGAEVAQQLLELPFDHIFFTGGTRIGQVVMKAAAQHLSSITLELGGKSPVIIDASAKLEHAAARIAWGKFINAGQTCVAPDYILVPESGLDRLGHLLAQEIRRSWGESNQVSENPDYCRIVNQGHFERIRGLLEDAVEKGASLVTGGQTDPARRFIAPTVLKDVPAEADLMEHEIFGPLLPLIPYRGLDEALDLVKAHPHPLALYIFSRSSSRTRRILDETRAGDTLVNDVVVHFSNVALPFGGIRQSGLGKSHGRAGFRAFTNQRSVMQQAPWTALWRVRPPYTEGVRRLIRLTLKYF